VIDQVLTGERVRLRPVRPEDKGVLTTIFSDPGVERWWGDPSRSVRDALKPEEGESCFVIESGSEPIGFIQCVEEIDPMYEHAGIDISLRSEWQGRGFGPDAITTLARHLIEVLGHHRLTIDPAAHNTHAIKAYERVGFKRVGVMRNYERGLDGAWHDGLLMDLLAGELRRS
jgi:aminoglycoside 6'-N-acetyltransferase